MNMAAVRVPPGRAGRIWLREHLDLAEHGVALLEHKLTILKRERAPLRERTERARREWETRCRDARIWQLRALLAGGGRSLTDAATAPAVAHLRWTNTAGVRHPDTIDYHPAAETGVEIIHNASIVHARDAHRAAVAAAADYAAATAALRAVEQEYNRTRIRAQGLRRHRIPDLRAALDQLDLMLEEDERTAATTLRRATHRGQPHRRA
jgi:V/A-type H+/Na+-transporting ATPase subunit D